MAFEDNVVARFEVRLALNAQIRETLSSACNHLESKDLFFGETFFGSFDLALICALSICISDNVCVAFDVNFP